MSDSGVVDILLVEDSDADAEMTIRALNKGKLAPKLVWVKDGVEALDFVHRTGAYRQRRDGHPRLILLDIKMPRLSGIDVLRRLKSDDRTRMIPVAMLTSSAEEQDLVTSYELGVNSYLVKPVDSEAFVDVVACAGRYWALMNRVPD